MLNSSSAPPWDTHVLAELIDELAAIRASCLEIEHACEADLSDVHPTYRDSARNLLHYLALRRGDIRALQKRLASLGLSSLGRTESHVLDNLTAVSRILHCLVGRPWSEPGARSDRVDFAAGKTLLHQHTDARASEQEARHAPAAAGVRDAPVGNRGSPGVSWRDVTLHEPREQRCDTPVNSSHP